MLYEVITPLGLDDGLGDVARQEGAEGGHDYRGCREERDQDSGDAVPEAVEFRFPHGHKQGPTRGIGNRRAEGHPGDSGLVPVPAEDAPLRRGFARIQGPRRQGGVV